MRDDEHFYGEAFHMTCKDAMLAKSNYVSLYEVVPFYGGPEEGGWWGRDTVLVAYKKCACAEEASAIRREVEKLAKELSEVSRRAYGDHCLLQMEWLEARGLDADYLPEPDGESFFFVAEEEVPGEQSDTGSRYYE